MVRMKKKFSQHISGSVTKYKLLKSTARAGARIMTGALAGALAGAWAKIMTGALAGALAGAWG